MKIRIMADSSCDMRAIADVDFVSAPLTVYTDERSFTDDEHLDVDEMLAYLASYHGRSYTACPNTDAWLRCYEGADVIYVVTLSSGVSGTYNAAMTAAGIYLETHPDAKIHVFDTKSAGPHVRLVVDKIAEYVREGMAFDAICEKVNTYMQYTRVFFALESFHNFAQNGRVNKVVAKAAGLMGIRIMATASKEGVIDIVQKCRAASGTKKAFLDQMKNAGYAGGKCYIAHCKNEPFAQQIAEQIRALYPSAQVSIYETGGLCSYYAEKGGILLSCECETPYV